MVKPVLHGAWSTTTEKGIEKVQSKIGIVFPKVFVDFLKKNNGGAPSPNVFPVVDVPHRLTMFYGIGGGESMDISIFYKNVQRFLESRFSREERKLVEGLLPFAEDDQSNILLLREKPDSTENEVCLLDKRQKTAPILLQSLGSFSEFLMSFYPTSNEEEDEEDRDSEANDEDEDYGNENSSKKRKRGVEQRPKKKSRRNDSEDEDEEEAEDRAGKARARKKRRNYDDDDDEEEE